MKKKVIMLLFLVTIFVFNVISYAVTAPEPMITSHKYSVNSKMKYKEITDIQIGEKLQLYLIIAEGNEMR